LPKLSPEATKTTAVLAKPIWALVRTCARMICEAIFSAPTLDMARLAGRLKDTKRKRRRQATMLC